MTRRELFLKPLALMLLGRIKTALPSPIRPPIGPARWVATGSRSPFLGTDWKLYDATLPGFPVILRDLLLDCETDGDTTVEISGDQGKVYYSFKPEPGKVTVIIPLDKVIEGNLVLTTIKSSGSTFLLRDFDLTWESV